MRSVKFGAILSSSLITAALALGLSGCESAESDPPPPGQIIIIDDGAGGAGEPEATPEPSPEGQPEGEPEAEPEGNPEPAAEPEGEPEPQASCGGGEFVPVNEVIDVQDFGPRYLGLDSDSNPLNGLFIEFHEERGAIEAGVFDLAGTNFSDCSVCVVGVRGCNPQTGMCAKRFYPSAGRVLLEEYGGSGGNLRVTLEGIDFQEAELTQAGSSFVDGGESWCIENHEIEGRIVPPPARLGDAVSTEFTLQNCETEEFVNMRELLGDKAGLWMVATAGWCPACRQFIPQVINNLPMIGGMVEVVFVLGENAVYGAPTLNYCRTYSSHYEVDDASRFYIDSSGGRSFATTFEHVWPYLGADGSFGLPWNGMIRAEGDGWVYHYSDRSGDGRDLNAALNELLR